MEKKRKSFGQILLMNINTFYTQPTVYNLHVYFQVFWNYLCVYYCQIDCTQGYSQLYNWRVSLQEQSSKLDIREKISTLT